jgi:transcriptional adapter 2-alpha
MGIFDRLQTSRISKPTPPVEAPSQASALVSTDLTLRPYSQSGLFTPPASDADVPTSNGVVNGVPTPQEKRVKYIVQPVGNTPPLKFDKENVADLHLLTPEEKEVCSVLRIYPKAYIAIKEAVLKEAIKNGGALKKKVVRELCRIDTNKGGRLFDFFVHSNWIQKA